MAAAPAGQRLLARAALALLLAGCATQRAPAPPGGPPDPLRRAALQALPSYSLHAQLAASNGSEGFSAQLDWRQQGDAAHARLRAPLGVGGAELDYAAGELRYLGSDGRRLEGAAAEEALARSLGFAPPLASLRYWLLAVPDPSGEAIEQADAQGRPLHLAQSGWRVDYADYQPPPVAATGAGAGSGAAGQWLPGRITLERAPLRLKLRILRWDLP
jgi:outer membrane lipoprotein LolB